MKTFSHFVKNQDVRQKLLNGKNWYDKSYSAFYIGIYEQGMAIAREMVRNPYAPSVCALFQNYQEKDHFDWFWNTDELRKKREGILKKAFAEPSWIDTVYKEWKEKYELFNQHANSVSHVDTRKLSTVELKEFLSGLDKALLDSSLWAYSVDTFLSESKTDWLVEAISGFLGDRANSEMIEILTLPVSSSFVNEAEVLFLKIAEALSCKDLEKASRLSAQYEERYFWIRTNYKEYSRVSREKILSEASEWVLKNERENITGLVKKAEERIEENKLKKQKLFDNLNASSEFLALIKIAELFTHFQDKRKEKVLRMNTLFYEAVAEVEKRFSIQHPLGFYLSFEELLKVFEGTFSDWDSIQDRYEKGFLTIFYNDSSIIIPSYAYKNEGIDKIFFRNIEVVSEIKGSIAYKGFVMGRVRVCKTVQDIAFFQEGEVLVANQTTPEYVPAMKKAVAFITDQGGITSHAAIISRELKVPCIIGTKIATKVLKDGDMVEVDANKGVVKIIDKAK